MNEGDYTMRPEIAALIELAAPAFGWEEASICGQRLAARAAEFDWPSFLDQAHRHNVMPLLADRIRRFRVMDDLNTDPRFEFPYERIFQQVYEANQARNAALLRELSLLVWSLNQVGVEPLIRKGAVLIDVVFHDAAARYMADADLVVDREQFEAADTVMRQLGYVEGKLSKDRRTVEPLSRTQRLYLRTYIPNRLYARTTSEPFVSHFVVDFSFDHFIPGSGYSLPTSCAPDRTEPFDIGQGHALRYDPVHMLIDLLTHFYKEATTLMYIEFGLDLTLMKIVDIAGFARAEADRFDWDHFVAFVKEADIDVPCHFALAHVNAVYPSEQLAAAARAVEPATADHLRQYGTGADMKGVWDRDFRDRMFDPDRTHSVPRSSFARPIEAES